MAKDTIGKDEYAARLAKTEKMLSDLQETGSYLRYTERRIDFEKGMAQPEDQYKPSACEKETGVSMTALVRGEVILGNLMKEFNEVPILAECVARGLLPIGNPGKVTYSAMRKLIKIKFVTIGPQQILGKN